ncbi:murein transglycosylase domain-containing protein [Helicobacter turcicus]|uniref:Murein transglycosylase domain-containing protein n=1 Tax=Helicobacter turcicus TaxID=2867412 RepID=A0ABS7JPL6_9HELI|nr:murein transglycosylase domain-containing protein [Helicobacter turcicus]MBX7491307.1 murein transglycosylase domain-containing protein [Helicobacter turcicus]MBX7546206.1 murein transglycosylase domain-containing protein [Helicobacter turcicus]
MKLFFRNVKIFSISVVFLALLSGCLIGYRDIIYNPSILTSGISKEQVIKKAVNYALNPEQLEKDIANLPVNFKKVVAALTQKVAKQWGENNTPTASQDVYVKYTDSYLSRAQVDFTKGVISVATLDTKNPKASLKKAIVATLLTPEDPEQVDLYSDKEISFKGKPYLADLVKDNEDKVVLYPWRANRYADYLIANKLQTTQITEKGESKKVYYVQFNMVKDHEIKSEHKYGEYVALYAREYNLEQALIFAIIKTESSFNPYAVSHIPAYGLMQVVPGSAGRDVYRSLNNRDGIPTKEMLFTPKTNIQYGSAYLDILFKRYIKGVNNALSHEYCVIAAYNTGSGNVLSVFDKDRTKAVKIINSMTSAEVYRKLRTSLKYEEARNYLHKVTNAKKDFQKNVSLAQNVGLNN